MAAWNEVHHSPQAACVITIQCGAAAGVTMLDIRKSRNRVVLSLASWLRQVGEYKDGVEVLGLAMLATWFCLSTLSYQLSPAAAISVESRITGHEQGKSLLVARVVLENKNVPLRVSARKVYAESAAASPQKQPSQELDCGASAFDPLPARATLAPGEKLSFECILPLDAASCFRVYALVEGSRSLLSLPWFASNFKASSVTCGSALLAAGAE